jgi:hypothetical protein
MFTNNYSTLCKIIEGAYADLNGDGNLLMVVIDIHYNGDPDLGAIRIYINICYNDFDLIRT